MDPLKQTFNVNFNYDVYFTNQLFAINNQILRTVIKKQAQGAAKMLVVIDEKIAEVKASLCEDIKKYAEAHKDVIKLCGTPLLLPGSELIKNDRQYIKQIYQAINDHGICRHSYVVAIGGGALLDAVGFVAATAHRGIRLIRVPTTVLSQDDSGVGVKNGINYFGKKNYLGVFTPPYAVLNDLDFLKNLTLRDWTSGIAEATKVSLIKDAIFFHYINSHAKKLVTERDMDIMREITYRSSELHMQHIGRGGDPFELGSSRPLDFGHWAAHKLEQITNHRLRHGEAVAIGVALDSTYSYLTGILPKNDWEKILATFNDLQLSVYVPELEQGIDNPEDPDSIFKGLTEFREHLGGELTIMMLEKIGKGIEIHEVNFDVFKQAISILKEYHDKYQLLLKAA